MKSFGRYFFLLMIFLIRCSSDSKEIVLQELLEIELKNNYYTFRYVSQIECEKNNANVTKLHFIDLIQRKNIIVDLRRKNIEEIPLKGQGLQELFYFSLTGDTIYSFINDYNTLVLKDKNFQVLGSFSIPEKYALHATSKFLLHLDKNEMIMANASKTISFQKEIDRKQYYSKVKPVLKIHLLDTSDIYYTIGKFPEKYEETGANYYDTEPTACFGDNSTICLSFGACHMLYKYKDSILIYEKEVKSDYIEEFIPFPDEKVFDMLFLKKYINEEPRYTDIVYDPWRKHYYRIVKHRSRFDQKTGKSSSKKWSVIIADKEFNKIDEIVFDNSYNPHVFVPVEDGIIMHKSNSAQVGNSVLKLFRLEIND